jgi:alkyl hydroperoxide reductase subunit D
MSLESLKARLPEYAKDLRLNIGTVLSSPSLTPRQAWGAALASAIAARNPKVIAAIEAEAAQRLDATAMNAARAAAAIMSMTNIYYRFTHLVSAKDYA